MFNVLVVDDEKLVRKGIVNIIPWENYGMQAIGEAENAETALAFMATHPVDLLFTDLSMPGLTGMDFLSIVRERYPNTAVVVLTMHQEFSMIQQSMRLGVLDYITKEQIVEENIDLIMKNIADKFHENKASLETSDFVFEEDWVPILYSPLPLPTNLAERFSILGVTVHLLNARTAVFVCNGQNKERLLQNCKLFLAAEKDTILIQLSGVQTMAQVSMWLQNTMPQTAFLHHVKGQQDYRFKISDFPARKAGEGNAQQQTIIAKLKEIDWIVEETLFHDLLDSIKTLSIPFDKMEVLFYQINVYWAHYTKADINRYFDEVAHFYWWHEWEEWLKNIRATVKSELGENAAEISHNSAIQKVLSMVNQNFTQEITLEDAMHLSGMSKSHFCKHFKRITGETFIEYLNNLRVEDAKNYLTTTSQPVYVIAEKIGIPNERYFRKIFQEKTGLKPTQYRNRYKVNGG